jgi:hypothetical protein
MTIRTIILPRDANRAVEFNAWLNSWGHESSIGRSTVWVVDGNFNHETGMLLSNMYEEFLATVN